MSEPSESPHDSLNYAFLVHSQKTLTQNLPPRVDNKLLARQKRRRTSPEDHAVLEAAYQQNPKPDKASRAAIVSRVSLGEKEVQIWFQNRRQNDRRKSKPLQPHELLAPRVAMEPSSEDTPETLDDEISAEVEADHDASSSQIAPDEPLSSSQAATDEGPSSSQIATDIDETDAQTQQTQQQTQTTTTAQAPTPGAAAAGTEAARVMTPETSKRKRSSSDLQDAKVKSPPSLRISLSFDGEALVRKEGEITPSPPKSRSALRISMSSDGEAVIRADNEPSPSKNRLRRVTARRSLSGCVGAGLPGSHSSRSLRRSHSAILPVTPRAATTAAVADRERPFGRSRDPRVWQSTFDTDARSALSNSSCKSPAASADGTTPPSLFRSRSQRSSLSSRQNILANHNQNSPIPVPVPGSVHEKRRKLSRTVSSLGRLESNIINNGNNTRSPLSKVLTSSSSSNSASNPSKMGKGEDDDENKENWIPGTRISNNHLRRRTTVSHFARPVLADSNQKRSRLSQKDKDASIPGSQDEDLDCIQGLLSLSQGAWR